MEEKDKNNINNKIILFPVGGEDARKHYKDSVETTSDLKSFEDIIDARELIKYIMEKIRSFVYGGLLKQLV